jgi:myo-inositol-1(or 4)-monophosphatase
MDEQQRQHLLTNTIEITRAAGAAIMSFYRASFSVTDKSPDNPVTDADIAADRLLRERLMTLVPEAGWLSEETADSPERIERDKVWVVDPLDGTKEFVLGIPEFSVAVALVEHGAPLLGVVFNPATGELFQAARGLGARYNGRRAEVSDRINLAGAAVDASRSEIRKGEFEPFTDLVSLKIVGSIAYKLARVSAGQCDATWSRGPKHEWDICAGTFLITEAGGRVVDLNGDPITYNKSHPKVNGIIANNGHLHDALLQALAPHGPARREPGFVYRTP